MTITLTDTPRFPAEPTPAAPVRIPIDGACLDGDLSLPPGARGLILFVHGAGGSRHGRRDAVIASALASARFGTLRFDLLTPSQTRADLESGALRFDVPFLASRVEAVAKWALRVASPAADLPLGCFAAGSGAAAALAMAAARPALVNALVCRGGWPAFAPGPSTETLARVQTPTLLIVGGHDAPEVLDRNRHALALLGGAKQLKIIPGASHLFAERGAIHAVARLAREWFEQHFREI
jgi:pimeloyl-ACP methyl ester carboxylesterase